MKIMRTMQQLGPIQQVELQNSAQKNTKFDDRAS